MSELAIQRQPTIIFDARHFDFANDSITAKIARIKVRRLFFGGEPLAVWPASALCGSRSYGSVALRTGCDPMEHPFEDAVMDRV